MAQPMRFYKVEHWEVSMPHIAVAAFLALAGAAGDPPQAAAPGARSALSAPPFIALWTDDRDFYRKGDRVEAGFRSVTDGYVTVFRVDTDGRLEILFPQVPGQDNYVRGGSLLTLDELRGRSGQGAFVVDDYPGVGYLFAVVSLDRFAYGEWVRHGRWDYSAVRGAGRVRGDPYVVLTELVEYLLPPGYGAYAYDIVPYLVAHRPPLYNPYRDWCATFRTAAYDFGALEGGYYYPTTTYPVAYPVAVYLPAHYGRTAAAPRGTRSPAARRPAPGFAGRDPRDVRRTPAPGRSPGIAGDPRRPPDRRGAARPADLPTRVAGRPAAPTNGRGAPRRAPRRTTVARGYH